MSEIYELPPQGEVLVSRRVDPQVTGDLVGPPVVSMIHAVPISYTDLGAVRLVDFLGLPGIPGLLFLCLYPF